VYFDDLDEDDLDEDDLDEDDLDEGEDNRRDPDLLPDFPDLPPDLPDFLPDFPALLLPDSTLDIITLDVLDTSGRGGQSQEAFTTFFFLTTVLSVTGMPIFTELGFSAPSTFTESIVIPILVCDGAETGTYFTTGTIFGTV